MYIFVGGLVAHAYGFMQNSFSHDALNAFIATKTEDIWKIELGRIFVIPYRMIFRGNVTIPWLIGVLGLVWTSIAVCLVVQLFETKSLASLLFVSGIMVTNITYTSQIATYMHEFDVNALALLLSIVAVYLWRKKRNIWSIILGGVCLALSIGLYQAYLSTTLVLIIWLLIMDLLKEKKVSDVLKDGGKGSLVVLFGGGVYFLATKIVYWISGIEEQSRTSVYFFKNGQFILFKYVRLIPYAMEQMVKTLIHYAYPRKMLCVLLAVTLLFVGIGFIYVLVRKSFKWNRLLAIGGLILSMPFAMSIIFFLARGKNVHDLMWYSVWFVYIFILLMAFWIREECVTHRKLGNWLGVISSILVIFILSQNVVLSNTAYMKKDMEADATLSTMTRVLSMIEDQEEYVLGKTPVAFVGVGEVYEVSSDYGVVSSIKGLANNTQISQDASTYYYNVYKAYFDYVLNYPINLVDDETHAQIKENKDVQELPTFPQKGCVQMIDNVLVVKMGEIK